MRKTLWGLLIFCFLAGLPPMRKSEKYVDILTAAEKVKIEELWNQGELHEDNIQQFLDRFALAPDRETAIQHALDSSLRARVERHLQGIKNVFVEGPGLIKAHYKEHGIIGGTGRILRTVVSVPYRSWKEIFWGEPGLGDNPIGTLCGAASVIFIVLLIRERDYPHYYLTIP